MTLKQMRNFTKNEKGGIIFNILFFIIYTIFVIYLYDKLETPVKHIIKARTVLSKAKSLAEFNVSDEEIIRLFKREFQDSPYKISEEDIVITRSNDAVVEICVIIKEEISLPFGKKSVKLELKKTAKIIN